MVDARRSAAAKRGWANHCAGTSRSQVKATTAAKGTKPSKAVAKPKTKTTVKSSGGRLSDGEKLARARARLRMLEAEYAKLDAQHLHDLGPNASELEFRRGVYSVGPKLHRLDTKIRAARTRVRNLGG